MAPSDPPRVNPPIRVPEADARLLLACMQCGHEATILALSFIRGFEHTCEKCGVTATASGSVSGSRYISTSLTTETETAAIQLVQRTDGVWVFLNNDEKSILDVLDHDSDRSVAVLTGSLIEDRLTRAIRARSQRDKTIEDRLFHPSGPLGSFAAKIDLAYLTGILSPAAHRDLIIFKDIRNLFAHNLGVRDFRSPRIRDKANNLRLVDTMVGEIQINPDGSRAVVALGHNQVPVIFVKHAAQRKKRARNRYLMTAQIFTVRFGPTDLKQYYLPLI